MFGSHLVLNSDSGLCFVGVLLFRTSGNVWIWTKITLTECRAQPQTCGVEFNLEFETENFILLVVFVSIFYLISQSQS